MKCISCKKTINSGMICPSCGQDNSKIQELIDLSNYYYNLGLDLANEGKITKAIVELEKSTSIYKDNMDAINLLGLCYFRIGRFTEGLNEWIYSTNKFEFDNVAFDYLDKLDKDEEFVKLINQCVESYNRCLDLVDANNIKVAILQLQKIAEKIPEMIEPQLLLVMLRIKENDYINALRDVKKVLVIDDDNERALKYLSEIEKVKDRYTIKKIEKIREEAAITHKDKTAFLKEYSLGRTIIDLAVGILVGVGVMLFLVMPAIKDNQNNSGKEVVLDQNQQISDLRKQLEMANDENKSLANQNEEIKKENISIEEERKSIAAALYQSAINSFESKLFPKSIEFMELSFKYDDTVPEVYILYLRAKLILGEIQEAEKITEEIAKKFPNTTHVQRAKDILEATKRQISGIQ